MEVVNLLGCEPDDTFGQGAFRARVLDLGERLGASFIGATVWDVPAGAKSGPYHFHHGVEEWLYAVSGAPLLRTPDRERALEPGELVAFPAGPAGAHTLAGPGRVVLFSAGDRGWGEAFLSVYPDSDKLAGAPGVIFRRSDAIGTRSPEADGPRVAAGPGGRTWSSVVHALAPGEATAPYHYRWCREEWALVLDGAPTLRHAGGETLLRSGDVCCFPQGPAAARRLRNDSDEPARVVVFSTATDRPMSTFYPDEDTVLIDTGSDRLLFRHADRVEDYWDGEPGAA